MKLTKQEQDIVRRKFSKYCIEVLNGEALNYLEELDRLWEQEINFSDLGESILISFVLMMKFQKVIIFRLWVWKCLSETKLSAMRCTVCQKRNAR